MPRRDTFTYSSPDEFEKTYAAPNMKVNEKSVTPYATGSKKTLSITVNKQKYDEGCWAACTEALINYKYNSLSAAEQNKIKKATEETYPVTQTAIMNNIHGEGSDKAGDVNDMANALNYFLNITRDSEKYKGYIGSARTYSAMVTKIKLGKPVILAGQQTEGSNTTDHAMLCYGYDNTNSKELKLFVQSPTTRGTRNLTFVCSDESATMYDVYEAKNGVETKVGTYSVSGFVNGGK